MNNQVRENLQIPQTDIKEIIEDPEAYARDFMEIAFGKYLKNIKEAYENGKKLAESLKNE